MENVNQDNYEPINNFTTNLLNLLEMNFKILRNMNNSDPDLDLISQRSNSTNSLNNQINYAGESSKYLNNLTAVSMLGSNTQIDTRPISTNKYTTEESETKNHLNSTKNLQGLNSVNNSDTKNHHSSNTAENLDANNDTMLRENEINNDTSFRIKIEQHQENKICQETLQSNDSYKETCHQNLQRTETELRENVIKSTLQGIEIEKSMDRIQTTKNEIETSLRIQTTENITDTSLHRIKTDLTESEQNAENIDIVENEYGVDIKSEVKEECLVKVNDQLIRSLQDIIKEKCSKFDVKSEPENVDDTSSYDLLVPKKVRRYRERSPVEERADRFEARSSKRQKLKSNCSLTNNKMVAIKQTIQTKDKQRNKTTKDNKQNRKVPESNSSGLNIQNYDDNESSSENGDQKIFEPVLSCNKCSYTTWNETNMDLHARMHEKKEPVGIFPCKICEFVTQDKAILTKHLIQHNGKKPFTCFLCNVKCLAPSYLIKHMKNNHPEITKPFSCNVCEYKSANNSDIIRHTRTHTGEKPFSCKLCAYRCRDISSLGFHMRTHTGEKPYSCTLCEYRSKCNSALVSHMRRHTGERPYKCKACDFKFKNNSDLVRHMKLNTGENLSCKICEFSATANCVLAKHLRTHVEEKKYTCFLCSFVCTRNTYLMKHMRTHNGKNAYSCKICEFTCDSYVAYTKHVSKHAGEKTLICEICSYESKGRQGFAKHMRTHTGFSCTHCEFNCLRKGDLAAHVRSHMGEKPFLCAHCAYTCKSGRSLAKHVQKKHAGQSEVEFII